MTIALAIAAASEEDREWCARLMAGSEPWITLGRDLEQCRARFRKPEFELFLARRDGEPCGFILIHPHGVAGSPYISTIAVAPEWRGQGFGTRLVDFAEAHCAGARYIFLCVSSFNPRARQLYQRLGYTTVGILEDYIVDGSSEFLMHKRLVAR